MKRQTEIRGAGVAKRSWTDIGYTDVKVIEVSRTSAFVLSNKIDFRARALRCLADCAAHEEVRQLSWKKAGKLPSERWHLPWRQAITLGILLSCRELLISNVKYVDTFNPHHIKYSTKIKKKAMHIKAISQSMKENSEQIWNLKFFNTPNYNAIIVRY